VDAERVDAEDAERRVIMASYEMLGSQAATLPAGPSRFRQSAASIGDKKYRRTTKKKSLSHVVAVPPGLAGGRDRVVCANFYGRYNPSAAADLLVRDAYSFDPVQRRQRRSDVEKALRFVLGLSHWQTRHGSLGPWS
jgi:hypothetical protein